MSQVIVGKLISPHEVKTSEGIQKVGEWNYRAIWSYLRLQHGRKIDDIIKSVLDQVGKNRAEREREFRRFFASSCEQATKKREIQFILDFHGDVMAVASLKHLLIPPAEVYAMAKKILGQNGVLLKQIQVKGLEGLTYEMKQVAGFKVGLQLFGGSITTRRAITMTSWLRVELCLNPLSWLGVGGFSQFLGGRGLDYERVLRIKVKSELEPRLKQAIQASLSKINSLEKRAKETMKVLVEPKQARTIITAMGMSYTVGVKTIRQIIERFEKEPKTQWGLSMAGSWVAAHGKFRKTPKQQNRAIEQKISTISGATLLLDNIRDAESRSLDWLKRHVKSGEVKSIDTLMQEYDLK